ncbi:MAG: FecR domain-containing protein [Bacteroidota bacterium]
MNPKKYLSFGSRDFAEDDMFTDWVLNQNPEMDQFWTQFLDDYPEKEAELEAARNLILNTQDALRQIQWAEGEQEAMHQALLEKVRHQQPPLQEMPSRSSSGSIQWGYRWAAAIVLICAIGAALYFSQQKAIKIRHATGYGEIQTFSLPDGSEVKLHAHSTLEFYEDWMDGKDREVWLEGEAFFSVEKKPVTQAKFRVHTQDLAVEVLGTEFNVDTRKNKTEVVLKEGAIKLQLQDEQQKSIMMEPGDLVSFSQKQNKLAKRKVNSRIRTSWKEGIQLFEKSPLEEVIAKIEDIYGIKVEIQDTTLFDRNLTLGVPVENLEIAIATLENILGKSFVPMTENQFRIK